MSPRRGLLAAAALVVAAMAAALVVTLAVAPASASSRLVEVTYRAADPGDAVSRLRVRGSGCLASEDGTRLRLVSWAPSRSLAVFRCAWPEPKPLRLRVAVRYPEGPDRPVLSATATVTTPASLICSDTGGAHYRVTGIYAGTVTVTDEWPPRPVPGDLTVGCQLLARDGSASVSRAVVIP